MNQRSELVSKYRHEKHFVLEKNPTMWRKIEKKLIQSEEFNMKESQRYNVSVLKNHYQDLGKMLSNVVRSPIDV